MGTGLAVDLILHGIGAVLVDQSVDALEKARSEIISSVRFAPLIKRTAPRVADEDILTKIRFTTSLSEVHNCDFIIENVTEDIKLKEEIYRNLDRICPPDICFGVNTSCISITHIGGVTARASQIIGIHLMNPVFLKSSVEVIRGYHTSEHTIQLTRDFLSQLGKDAIVVNDYPGFVSNRISHLFMNEAAFVVQDQVAQPKEVDDIFKKCYGHTMGPLETADLIGLDTVVHSLDVLYQSYQDSKFRCCPLLRKMVAAGLWGKKSGQGFYTYNR
ncbi:3-hydroxybutyryl-CoA dehydrogenase [Tengunoibacter tsumagoiensis]|uniref:3-hydroxybutyryl-CoA dehydrogenase n=2 Tax=Tengunoibacter tsumagoiensis TaxID=2014871 RepID=A0A402AA10_9CHLR|nr:3-hydroxybutyryl-CoA dehydrogenase [Tengunoibacter tsumagoiensis]